MQLSRSVLRLAGLQPGERLARRLPVLLLQHREPPHHLQWPELDLVSLPRFVPVITPDDINRPPSTKDRMQLAGCYIWLGFWLRARNAFQKALIAIDAIVVTANH